jgi:hypothetical protein
MSWEEFQQALEKHVEEYCESVISKNLEEMEII